MLAMDPSILMRMACEELMDLGIHEPYPHFFKSPEAAQKAITEEIFERDEKDVGLSPMYLAVAEAISRHSLIGAEPALVARAVCRIAAAIFFSRQAWSYVEPSSDPE